VGDGIITSSGLVLGNVGSGRTMVFRFKAEIGSDDKFDSGLNTMENKVTVTSNNSGTAESKAIVYVSKVQTVFDNFALSVQKLGRNITRGENNEQSAITAQAEDTIEFLIKVKSLSTTRVHNVMVKDILPSGLNYISKTTAIDGIITADGIQNGGINIGSLDVNQIKVVKFSAQVSGTSSFGAGTTFLTNTAEVKADSVPTLSATLSVAVTRGQVGGITKVAGVSTGSETGIIAAIISVVLAGGLVLFGQTNFAKRRGALKFIRSDRNRLNFLR
jgi:uncharacterized repeat protein (TIGR01451 family)